MLSAKRCVTNDKCSIFFDGLKLVLQKFRLPLSQAVWAFINSVEECGQLFIKVVSNILGLTLTSSLLEEE